MKQWTYSKSPEGIAAFAALIAKRTADAAKRAAEKITKKCGNIGDGFIILSEIIVVIKNNSFNIGETETIFVNRVRGESSVNIKLIIASLYGILKLYFIKNKLS